MESHFTEVVLNAVLTYATSSLNNSPVDYIIKCIHDFYTLEELTAAKDILWAVGDDAILPQFHRRRDTSQRSALDATISDMIEGLQALDEADKMPLFAVDATRLQRIPKTSPSETSSLSICERLANLERRLASHEDSVSINTGKVLSLEESISSMSSWAGVASRPPGAVGRSSKQTIIAQPLVVKMPPPNTNRKPGVSSSSQIQSSRRKEAATLTHASSSTSLISNASLPAGYEYSSAQRRKIRRKAITGTKSTQGTLRGAPEPSRDLFVFRVEKGNTEEIIRDYIKDNNIEPRNVSLISNKDATFASFKVEVALSNMNDVLSPDFWPTGVCVRRFHKPRQNTTP